MLLLFGLCVRVCVVNVDFCALPSSCLFIYSDLFASLFASLFSVREGRPWNWKAWEDMGAEEGRKL